jgi:hypothetical protein
MSAADTCYGTIWVCVDCMFIHENGETSGEPDREPWCVLEPNEHVCMGMARDEHAECDEHDECECETQEFSWQSCDGCGSRLGGSRHAFTLYANNNTKEPIQ